jgi:hypothetical protein
MTLARHRTPLAVFAGSLALSISTVGSGVYWQDSGFYLAAVRDLAVLYPHGFVLYELLCRGWTQLLFFVDFTLAVHLFSALCGALGSAALGLAVRDLLRARGGLFRVLPRDPGPLADDCGTAAGLLFASAYTVWSSSIYAKVYAFFYLVLAALLWRMIRAAESGRPRDLTLVAILIGLAWQAHPSAAGAGLALLGFVWLFGGALGARGLLLRVVLAAACALAPLLLLPALADGSSPVAFGEPTDAAEILRYATGARFVGKAGAFDAGGDRWVTAARFAWEDFLGVGLALAAAGAARMGCSNRRLLGGLVLWIAPYTVLTTVFSLEGQQDHWYVAAWLPAFLAAGVGLAALGLRWGRGAALGVAAAGVAWAVVANRADLDRRGYDLADRFGRLHLEPLAPEAIFLSTSDDTSSTTHYLQIVRKVRPDVIVVRAGQLGSGSDGTPGWYDRALRRREGRIAAPPYAEIGSRFPRAPKVAVSCAAFIHANAGIGRPLYVEEPPPPAMLPSGLALAPAGPLWRIVRRGEERLEDWPLSPEPEELKPLFRRARGQVAEREPSGTTYRAEPYERRLFAALLRARLMRAEWHIGRREFERAEPLYASILRADAETASLPEVVNPLGAARLHLGDAARARGAVEDARSFYAAGLSLPNLDPRLRAELRKRLDGR